MLSRNNILEHAQAIDISVEKMGVFIYIAEKEVRRKIKNNVSQMDVIAPAKWVRPSFLCIEMGKVFKCC